MSGGEAVGTCGQIGNYTRVMWTAVDDATGYPHAVHGAESPADLRKHRVVNRFHMPDDDDVSEVELYFLTTRLGIHTDREGCA